MKTAIITALFSLASSSAGYALPLQLREFSSIELRGAGEVTLKNGPVQQVMVEEDSTGVSTFSVDRQGRLIIQSCESNCGRKFKLRVVITRPSFTGLAVSGGGIIRADKGFPHQDRLALSVARGGSLDVRGINGDLIYASVEDGGRISASASTGLAATVTRGGSIRYRGNPQVSSAVSGGGVVTRD